jgi:hypothetical protein
VKAMSAIPLIWLWRYGINILEVVISISKKKYAIYMPIMAVIAVVKMGFRAACCWRLKRIMLICIEIKCIVALAEEL